MIKKIFVLALLTLALSVSAHNPRRMQTMHKSKIKLGDRRNSAGSCC